MDVQVCVSLTLCTLAHIMSMFGDLFAAQDILQAEKNVAAAAAAGEQGHIFSAGH